MKVARETLDAISEALAKGATIDDILRALGGEPRVFTKTDTCYRCWQVGREDVPGICRVRYNVGAKDEWISASCAKCLEQDLAMFPTGTEVVTTTVGAA